MGISSGSLRRSNASKKRPKKREDERNGLWTEKGTTWNEQSAELLDINEKLTLK